MWQVMIVPLCQLRSTSPLDNEVLWDDVSREGKKSTKKKCRTLFFL